jgi:hypothetical protein
MGPLEQRHQSLVALARDVDMIVALGSAPGHAQAPLSRRLALPQFQGAL